MKKSTSASTGKSSSSMPTVSNNSQKNIGVKGPGDLQLNQGDIQARNLPKIKFTLDQIAQLAQSLRNNSTELSALYGKCYPYMIAVVEAQFPEIHPTVMDLIVTSFDFFNDCTVPQANLVANILEMYKIHPGDIDLLQDCLAILQAFPYKLELFKQLIDRAETSECPALQHYLKIWVHLLSGHVGGSQTDSYKLKKKAVYPVLAKLVSYLTKAINHANAEVRKNVVLILVELSFLMEVNDFEITMQGFNPSQKKLVQIYIEKKQNKMMAMNSPTNT